MYILIGHVINIPTMQLWTGIPRITQSKQYTCTCILSWTEYKWEFQNDALWDTLQHALFILARCVNTPAHAHRQLTLRLIISLANFVFWLKSLSHSKTTCIFKHFSSLLANDCYYHGGGPSKTSAIVPIAVGIALAAMVVIVLIGYCIGRRRARSAGYESGP